MMTKRVSSIEEILAALPAVQADFGVTRGEASLPYTLIMVGFAFGGLVMGWITDRDRKSVV